MEYSTDVMAEPFDAPRVKGTTKVRLVEVFGVKITGGLGTREVTAARATPETGTDVAELGGTDDASRAMSTIVILIRFTNSAKSLD